MLIGGPMHLALLVAALLLDRAVGDPDWLWRRLPHPVVGFGAFIAFLDRRLNRDGDPAALRRRNGRVALVLLLAGASALGFVLTGLLRLIGPIGLLAEIVVVAILLAQKSLADHVAAVASGLRAGGLAGGREAVAKIVGRDPETLDEPSVCRAAIESLAENFSDGVVAPAFWYAVLGLPGLLAYKALNTADSMIGHRNARYIEFGRASAIADDWANFPAARISAGLIGVAAGLRRGWTAARAALGAARRDAGLHRSPNAGWPEAAMAGGLGIALAGPRIYGGIPVAEPMLNASGRRRATAGDIGRALGLYHTACTIGTVLVALALFVLA